MNKTNISWCDYTWNPVVGCTHVGSPGCDNCYARELHDMRHKAYMDGKKLPFQYAKPFSELQLFIDRLEDPWHVKKPSVIFVGSGTDLFHYDVPQEWRESIYHTMSWAMNHLFIVLTKRVKNMSDFSYTLAMPSNIMHCCTVTNQAEADRDIPILVGTNSAMRGISVDSMLGPITIPQIDRLDYVICGGETGKHARPMHPDWVRSLRDQCAEAGVPFHFKQWGEWLPDKKRIFEGIRSLIWGDTVIHHLGARRAGHLLDGVAHRDMPRWPR